MAVPNMEAPDTERQMRLDSENILFTSTFA